MQIECKARDYRVKNCLTILKDRGKFKITEVGKSSVKNFCTSEGICSIHSLTHKENKIFLLPFLIHRDLFFGFQLGTVIAPHLSRRSLPRVKQVQFKAKFYFLGHNISNYLHKDLSFAMLCTSLIHSFSWFLFKEAICRLLNCLCYKTSDVDTVLKLTGKILVKHFFSNGRTMFA